MDLKQPPPPTRTLEQLYNHYRVEKDIAARLMAADREGRKAIYANMYDELFEKVPDHPRLTRRHSEKLTANSNLMKLGMVKRFIDRSTVFLEYAPGDCRFAIEVAKHVKFAYGLDISDQRRPDEQSPENFELVVYDGYYQDRIVRDSVDVIFSDQLIEHFHPDDTRLHFEVAFQLLRDGGRYVFRTPHVLTGPHDISKYFSDEPECFHLKEWSYREIKSMLADIGYSKFKPFWYRRGAVIRLPTLYFTALEHVLEPFPKPHIRRIASLLISSVCGVAIK